MHNMCAFTIDYSASYGSSDTTVHEASYHCDPIQSQLELIIINCLFTDINCSEAIKREMS